MRRVGTAVVGSVLIVLGATACPWPPPSTFVVTTVADGPDADPGDGTCEMTTGEGDCSLRAAVMESNATDPVVPTTVELTGDTTYVLSVIGIDDEGAAGDLDVTRDVSIHGNGATITGVAAEIGVFEHHAGTLLVDHATLTGDSGWNYEHEFERWVGGVLLNHAHAQFADVVIEGHAQYGGTAIHQTGGVTTLLRSRVAGSTAHALQTTNAAITIEGGELNVFHSEVADNVTHTRYFGPFAGIRIEAGTARIIGSTVANHFVVEEGPGLVLDGDGIVNAGSVEIIQSTIVGNRHDVAGTGTAVVSGSVLGTCAVPITSGGHNLDRDSSCLGASDPSDVHTTDAVVGPLGFHGGGTRTFVPLSGSPVVDSIPAGTAVLCIGTTSTDQRGTARPVGAACDRGAVERTPEDP